MFRGFMALFRSRTLLDLASLTLSSQALKSTSLWGKILQSFAHAVFSRLLTVFRTASLLYGLCEMKVAK